MPSFTYSREACAPCVVVLRELRDASVSTTTTRQGRCEVCYAALVTLYSVTLVTPLPSSPGPSGT